MTEKTWKMGIVGTGNIARVHAMACKTISGVSLHVACDVNRESAKAFAETWGMPEVAGSIEELLSTKPDVVAICTPHPSHAQLIIRLAAAGIHCMVEKPLAVDLGEARLAVAAANNAGVKLGVIFQRRYWPAAQRLKKAVEEGRLGRIVQAECVVHYSRTLTYFSPVRSPWRGRWETEGGGVTVNQASHGLDMLQWLVGPFERLYAQWGNMTHPNVEVDTMVAATGTLTNGGLVSISLGLNPRQTDNGFFEVIVYGDNGAWASVREEPEGAFGLNAQWFIPGEEAEIAEITARERREDRRMYRIVEEGKKPPQLVPDCYQMQYQAFFDHLATGAPYDLTGEEGLKSVEIIEAIYRSADTDTPAWWPLEEATAPIARSTRAR